MHLRRTAGGSSTRRHLSGAVSLCLTPREQRGLDYVLSHLRDKGYAPSVREVMAHFSWASPNAAQGLLSALERKGAIVRERGLSRTIRPVPASLTLPYEGEVGP